MAFSTQRAFLNIHYRNEHPQLPDCKRSDCQLKTYESCTDLRAWSMDKMLSSQFVLDVAHKARSRKPPQQPDGDCELSREYLLQLDGEVLTEFVMCLMDELKRVKSQVRRLEDNRGNIDEQKTLSVQQIADASSQQREQLIEQQSSAFVSGKQHAEELADLKRIIDIMRAKAEKHNVLTQENKCLREKIEALRKTNSNSWHYSGDSDCGDSIALNCEALKAELRLYKNHYIEMKEQRREMMEQLQRAKLSERKVKALKNELYQEQLNRETIEKQLEDVLLRNNQQATELYRKNNYIAMCNRRLDGLESTTIK